MSTLGSIKLCSHRMKPNGKFIPYKYTYKWLPGESIFWGKLHTPFLSEINLAVSIHTCHFLGMNDYVNYSHNNGAVYQVGAFTPAIVKTIAITMQKIVHLMNLYNSSRLKIAGVNWPWGIIH